MYKTRFIQCGFDLVGVVGWIPGFVVFRWFGVVVQRRGG